MPIIAIAGPDVENPIQKTIKTKRIESIDLLRGIVMIIMALDHVRDYFHSSAFVYSPTDLSQTTTAIFFTRWITHFCAPVFVFLAGTSAYLYGAKKNKKQLSLFLFTRGLWLVIAELFIVTLEWTFNPSYPFFNLQVIWAIGISMIFLSAIIYMNKYLIFITGILLIAAHNLLDNIHVQGNGIASFLWALLHEKGNFTFRNFSFSILYPVLPWIGVMAVGYVFGTLYKPFYNPKKRQRILLLSGYGAIILFIISRAGNFYGDAAHWSMQKNGLFTLLSFLNVTKYPPSFLYILMTLGPALIFLSLSEKSLNRLTSKITIYGRVPMFYYLAHIFLIHLLAIIGAIISGYQWPDMILSTRVNAAPELQGYGFNLIAVYILWIGLIFFLYPFCKWFDNYKRTNQSTKWWLSYF
ncbi:MAG: heparan-alpha-glucosaminide N-acetyltransferase domain-containing protein [Ginsengibacter sp.]